MHFGAFKELKLFSSLRGVLSVKAIEIENILPNSNSQDQFKPDFIKQYRSIPCGLRRNHRIFPFYKTRTLTTTIKLHNQNYETGC